MLHLCPERARCPRGAESKPTTLRHLLGGTATLSERRFIGRGEISEVLRTGRINSRKSQPALRPCPKYTVDAAVGPRRKNVQVRLVQMPARLPACCRGLVPVPGAALLPVPGHSTA